MTTAVTAPVDLATVETRLAERGIASRRIRVGTDAHIVVSGYGSRVYGPFFGAGASEAWIPEAFGDPTAFAALHESGAWNVGGDRVWIGPEIEYMIPDRDRYWDTYDMPVAMDPATHVFAGDATEPTMHRHLRLRGHQRSLADHTDVYGSLDLGIRIRATPNPLRELSLAGGEDVSYGGYRTELTLSQSSGTALDAESWMLLQVRAGGTALVAGAPRMRVTDYYEPVGDLLAPRRGGVAVSLTGADRFKIGFAAPHVSGRMAYLRDLADGDAALVVRSSSVWPGFDYAEEPDFLPGHRGDALHMYNDDGGLGGFAELEARGTPIAAVRGGDGSTRPVTDRFLTWWFRGPRSVLAEIAEHLGHVDATRVTNA
jgi:hypothetical protein